MRLIGWISDNIGWVEIAGSVADYAVRGAFMAFGFACMIKYLFGVSF